MFCGVLFYQTWQYAVAAYTATCIIPFCAALLIGPGLLKDRLIGLTELFLAFLLPLPFLVRWCWLCFGRYRRCGGAFPPDEAASAAAPLGPEAKSVIETLQGPFKDSEHIVFGSICGQGMLIGRRLVLVLLYTFVNNTLMRTQCTMLLCFVNLLHHVHALPYRDRRGNAAGTASAVALVVVATINLLPLAPESSAGCVDPWVGLGRVHYSTHTHPFNGRFSGTTRVSRYQKGKTNLDSTEARDSEWQWHQLGHMQVCN